MSPNLFRNQTLSAVLGHIEFPTIFKLIRVSPYDQKITEARKYPKGHPEYERIKCSIPSFSPNACFFHKRSKENVKELTGFIYLDFDGIFSNAIFTKLPFVYACWLSFGGRGYGVLIKVKGVTLDNFTEVWLYLEDYFLKNYSLKVDPQTKDYSRQTVLSSDPTIYVNPAVKPIDVKDIDLTSYKTLTYEYIASHPDLDLFELPSNYSSRIKSGYFKIKYRTVLDDYENKPYVIIEEGHDSRDAFMLRKVNDGFRHRHLSAYAYSILFNNPDISIKILERVLMKANLQHCNPPLEDKEIIYMARSFKEQQSKNGLKIKTKKKMIWHNPEYNTPLHEKQVINGREVGKLRKKKTLKNLIEVYKELKSKNEVVSQSMVIANSNLSRRTIQKYWHEILQSAV
ncbi:MAG: hypothetical protein NTU98_07960 [Bacteroidetes bacterium]|nr:hypothetical protein [Bacteroidota bacterium]